MKGIMTDNIITKSINGFLSSVKLNNSLIVLAFLLMSLTQLNAQYTPQNSSASRPTSASFYSTCASCSPGGAMNYTSDTTISSSVCYASVTESNNVDIIITSGATLTICGDWVGQNVNTITVNAGGALVITGSLIVTNNFSLTSNGSVSIGSVTLNNGGAIAVSGTGSLAVTNNFTAGTGSSISVSAGAHIDVGGNLSIQSGSIVADGILDVAGTISGAQPSGAAVQYRSKATGNWGSSSTWEYSTNGTVWSATTNTPTSANGTITILNGHNVSVATSVTVDELTVDSGGTLTINSGQTITIANGAAAVDCQVNGTLSNVDTVTTTGALAFGAAGTYIHARVAGTVPLATWNPTSTCKITGATTALPSGITNTDAQTNMFGNFIWDCPNQTAEINFAAGGSSWSLFTLEGNFTVNNTGSSNLIFGSDNTNVNRTFTVKGNFEIAKTGTATVFYLNEYWDNITLNVYGEILISGGQFYPSKIQGEEQIINVEKGIETSGTGVFKSQNQTANNSLYTTINFTNTQGGGNSSNLSLSTGLTRYGQAAWNINVKSGRTVTLSSNIELGASRTFIVESGGTLVLPSAYVVKNNTSPTVATGTTFNLNLGGILKIENVDGIVTSGATGGIQTNTRTFNAGGHYHYIASVAQVTGNALPATISGSLVVNNTQAINASNSGVSLSRATAISGTLTLTAGVLTTTTNLLSITNTSSGAVSGGSATAFVNGPLKWTVANSGGGNYKFQIGKSGTYLPLNVGSPVGTVNPAITAQAFVTSSEGSAGTGLSSISTSEYWSIINTGTLTSSTISLAKSSIGSNDAIASSTTKAAAYTNNLATCTTTNTLINSNTITAGTTSGPFASTTYFVMATTLKPTITLALNTISAANICAGSTKVPIQSFSLAVTGGTGNLTNVGFTTSGGTFSSSDILNYKIWYGGTTNNLSPVGSPLATLTPTGGNGTAETFSAFTSPTLDSGSTYYFWITMDVASSTTNNATVTVSAITTSNLTSTSTKAGSTSAGGTQTLKVLPTISGTASVCLGSTTALTGSGTAATSNAWSSGTPGVATINTTTGTITPVSAGTTNITYTDNNGCTSVATTINVNATTTYSGTSWDNGEPDGTKSITINSPFTANSDISACGCTLNAAVTIASDKTLTLTNGLTVSGTGSLTFENNASLLQTNDVDNTGNITYKRTTSTLQNKDFVYWSSPVASQTLGNIWMGSSTAGTFYSFDPVAKNWATAVSGDSMSKGIGYIARAITGTTGSDGTPFNTSTWTAKFNGVPNNGNIQLTIVENDSYSTNRLIGNPYPSALDLEEFYEDNKTVLGANFYLWTHASSINDGYYTSNDYGIYNAVLGASVSSATTNRYVAAGQGFFAKTMTNLADASYTVDFKNTQRVSGNNTNFYRPAQQVQSRNSRPESHKIWLNLTNDKGAFKQQLLAYVQGATNDFDTNLEAFSFGGNPNVDFYSNLTDKKLVIQSRPLPFNADDMVPLGFKSTTAETYQVAIDHIDGLFLDGQSIYLEDKLQNVIHDLKQGAYTFATAAGTFNDRFVVRYTNSSSLENEHFDFHNSVQAITNDKVTVYAGLEPIQSIEVIDLLGRTLRHYDQINATTYTLGNLFKSDKVLFLKIKLSNQVVVTKKIIF